MNRRQGCCAAGLLLTSTFAACGTQQSADASTLTIAVAFYPIEEVVRAVVGDQARVISLVPPGESAHEFEPSARDVQVLESANIVFYLGSDFQPSVQAALAELGDDVTTVDLLESVAVLPVTGALAGTEGETDGEVLSGDLDPHVWLDPANMQLMTATVVTTLNETQKSTDAMRTAFATNSAAYIDELDALDATFRSRLTNCASTTVVTNHRAFEYLARAYGLSQLPIAGISPSEEPSAQTLEAVADAAKRLGVTTIFFEENLPADLSETIATEIGAGTAVLDPIESLSAEQLDAGATYSSVMRANLDTLAEGLQCD